MKLSETRYDNAETGCCARLDRSVWDEKTCIQCLKCVAICPHATIRAKVYDSAELGNAPTKFKSVDSRIPDFKGQKFTLQVAAEDCTGCALCVENCPFEALYFTQDYERATRDKGDLVYRLIDDGVCTHAGEGERP